MQVRISSTGDLSIGELGRVARVDETFDIPDTEHPYVELTLASGDIIRIETNGTNSIELMTSGMVRPLVIGGSSPLRIVLARVGITQDGRTVIQ